MVSRRVVATGLTAAAAAVCGCGMVAAATSIASQPARAAAVPAQRESHGYRLLGTSFVIRERHGNGTMSFQVRFRLNKRPPVDPAGGARLHVNLAGEGPETAPGRVGLRTRWCYASEIANDDAKIPATATQLDLAIRVGAVGAHTTVAEQRLPVVAPGKPFATAYKRLGCKA